MPTIWTFDDIENKHDVYRGADCMKKFCKSLREHEMKITNFGKKKMIPLTNKKQECYDKKKSATFSKKAFYVYFNDKNLES